MIIEHPLSYNRNFIRLPQEQLCFTINKCWAIKKQHVHKMNVVEMRILWSISGE